MTKRKPNTLCQVSLKEKDFTLFNEDLLTEALIGLVSKTSLTLKQRSETSEYVEILRKIDTFLKSTTSLEAKFINVFE